MSDPRLTQLQLETLKAWADCAPGDGMPFAHVSNLSSTPLHLVRRVVRALARKGMVAFHRSLWTDEGLMAGAGYVLTRDGRKVLDTLESVETVEAEAFGA